MTAMPISQRIKFVLARRAPGLLGMIRSRRRRAHDRREEEIAARRKPILDAFIGRFGLTVQSGPIAGLQYRPGSRSDTLLPRLVGSYEAEIHPLIRRAIDRKPQVIVDIGSEEGYFAAGFAMIAPGATVYAFDIDGDARGWTEEMARINGVSDRVVIGAECTREGLDALLDRPALVLCDCEGYEMVMMDPVAVPNLKRADILIEFHDHTRDDLVISETILARFAATHDATVVAHQPRKSPADFPCLDWLPEGDRGLALHENRMRHQSWVYLEAKDPFVTPS